VIEATSPTFDGCGSVSVQGVWIHHHVQNATEGQPPFYQMIIRGLCRGVNMARA
jgi:hypothetical protein